MSRFAPSKRAEEAYRVIAQAKEKQLRRDVQKAQAVNLFPTDALAEAYEQFLKGQRDAQETDGPRV